MLVLGHLEVPLAHHLHGICMALALYLRHTYMVVVW
jgi:hypothetical protein